MLNRLYIQDLQEELSYKDRRTVLKWCHNNDVGVLSDIGSNRLYVLKEEFLKAKMKQSVMYIKEKYGENKLPEFFNANMNFSNTKALVKKDKYVPMGEFEQNFLNCLQNF